ncbi:MAG TPA: hypothetical protein VGM92_01940 [Candidatus Kapabacteria bacterium]|jgi:hypothetical protein
MRIEKLLVEKGIEVRIVLENKKEVDDVANAMCWHYSAMTEDADHEIVDRVDICGRIADDLGLKGYGSFTPVDDDGQPKVKYSAEELLKDQDLWKEIYTRKN